MKLYVSEDEVQYDELNKFERGNYEESDVILILPGGLGSVNDLLKGIIDKKKTYVYNKDAYYDTFIKNIYESRSNTILEDSLEVEKDFNKLIKKLEEENERTNNGKNGKLL